VEWEPISAVSGVSADDNPLGADGNLKGGVARKLSLDLDAFAWEALEEEAAQLGVSVEELASFSVLYYLADRDSGRIVRRVPPPPRPGEPHPLGKLLPN
jgi:hypothetical protein